MLKNAHSADAGVQAVDRRSHARLQVRSVVYIELDQNNGGLILNIGEGGVTVQSAEMIVGDHFSRMRFQLPKSEKWIETGGKVVWLGESRKEAGIQFVDLDRDARQQIQNWIYSAAYSPNQPPDQGRFKVLWEVEEPQAHASEPAKTSGSSEIDSMFPSEKSLTPTARPARRKQLPSDPTPLDLGIAPGPVKRPRVPMGDQIPTPNPEEMRASGATAQAESAAQQLPSSRSAYLYSSESAALRDPFASIAVDHAAQARDAAAPPAAERAKAGEAPSFPLREHYRALAYEPQPFEEPWGKRWLLAGVLLVALLGVGAVFAIGPANVKNTVEQYISSRVLSVGAPPPPASASEKTPSPENGVANLPDGADSPTPSDTPQQGILNPGVAGPATTAPPSNAGGNDVATNHTAKDTPPKDTSRAKTGAAANNVANSSGGSAPPSAAVSPGRSEAAQTQGDTDESPETAEEITRRFQMEHSGGSSMSTPPPARENSLSGEAAAPVVSGRPSTVPQTDNQRTLDAYADPAPRPARSSATAAAPVNAPSATTAPVIPPGTVAIRSHFYAIRGDEPQQSLARQGLKIGQLVSIHQPMYPVEAERAHVEGTVQLSVTVDQTGMVSNVRAISGPPMLIAAAVDAVRQWRYAQTVVDSRAVESVNDVAVVFRLANSAALPR
jgi:TonB family protein